MNLSKLLPGGLAATTAAATTLACALPASAATPPIVAMPSAATPPIVALLASAATPPIVALPSATWTGGAPSGATGALWSHGGANGANWSGGVVPQTRLDVLDFPDLGASCDGGTATTSCYQSVDDLGPITVNQLSFSGGREYQIYPTDYDSPADTVTLEGNAPGSVTNVGLTATQPTGSSVNQLASFGVPIILGAAQQWNVGTKGIVYVNSISGHHPLALDLSDGYVQANDVESSALTISGLGEFQLDQAPGSPERVPSVRVNDSDGRGSSLAFAADHAHSGPISISGTRNNLIVLTDRAPGETRLHVSGNVQLDASTNVEFDIDGNHTRAGVDHSQLTASGSVALGGARLQLWQARNAGHCSRLRPGRTFVLLSARSLRGRLSVGGRLISAGESAREPFSGNDTAAFGSGDNCKAATVVGRVSLGSRSIRATIVPPATSRG